MRTVPSGSIGVGLQPKHRTQAVFINSQFVSADVASNLAEHSPQFFIGGPIALSPIHEHKVEQTGVRQTTSRAPPGTDMDPRLPAISMDKR